MPGSPHDDTEA